MKEFNCIFDGGIIVQAANIESAKKELLNLAKRAGFVIHDHEITWEE